MTITLGWWLIPALITLAAFVVGIIKGQSQGSYDFIPVFVWLLCALASTASWLIWALAA